MKISLSLMGVALAVGLVGCNATSGGSASLVSESRPAVEATACLSGDSSVADSSQCLQDDAACYEVADGSWCTGSRATNCPLGSDPLPAELPCPEGARCFAQSESLQCVIGG